MKRTHCLVDGCGARLRHMAAQCLRALALLLIGIAPASSGTGPAGQIDEASQLLISRLQDPALRTDALRDIQQYSDPPAPPRRQEWRERLKSLRERPEVRATIQQFGSIDRYVLTRFSG